MAYGLIAVTGSSGSVQLRDRNQLDLRQTWAGFPMIAMTAAAWASASRARWLSWTTQQPMGLEWHDRAC